MRRPPEQRKTFFDPEGVADKEISTEMGAEVLNVSAVAEKVKGVILGIIAIVAPDADLSDVKSDVRLRDQLDLDSMDFLDIVMELRKRYKIEVPKEDYPRLATLDSCVEYLAPKFAAMAG